MAIGRTTSRSPVAQFALTGLLATVLIGVLAVAVSRRIGAQQAIRDAKQSSRLAGEGIVAPLLNDAVMRGDPHALRQIDNALRRVKRGTIVRVKVWLPNGRIVYSDEPRLIGTRYPLGEEETDVLRKGGVQAEISDLSRPENSFERSQHKLLEVYLPVRTATRPPKAVLFEAYQRYSSVSASGARLWRSFAPALIGGLLLLQLVNLPLAHALANRLERGRLEREALLQRALAASDTERRVIAADLHDGVVQDLAGVSYSLYAQAPLRGEHAPARPALEHGAATTRDSIRALRTLLVDIYPPSLERSGLAAALGDLASAASTRGVATTAVVQPGLELSAGAAQLLFRCAQEALRNTHKHARASSARIEVQAAGSHAIMEVTDDGVGFVPSVVAQRRDEGHFGLLAMENLVHDAGGTMRVDTAPGAGTTVRVRVPR